MDTKSLRMILARTISIMVTLAITLSPSSVASAAANSPFMGSWQATDVDGSDLRLSIGGRPAGPFQITWTDNAIALCTNEAGIVRGMGWLNESDSNLIEADLHLECFTTDASLDFHVAFRYHAATNTLSIRYSFGAVTIWHRPGRPQAPPPALNLRVNYGDDWVESFYEGGHTAWITVTASDGTTVKGTAELVTEPKNYWGGESGFQSLDSVWLGAEGYPTESPPDIQPNDWVYGWVDNGASAQVQIGDINGRIDVGYDSIQGTISAPWITDPVTVECLDWGSGGAPFENKDGGSTLTDGNDSYSCSWAGEWDIQPGQTVGVGYFGPDGNWVANGFVSQIPTFVAYVPSAIEGYGWPMGSTITIHINDGNYSAQAVSEQRPDFPEGETRVLFELWRDDFSIKVGDHITMTEGNFTKDVLVTNLAVTDFNLGERTVSGTYDPAYSLWVWLYGEDAQEPQAAGSTWVAIFDELPPNAWGGATQWDGDGNGTSVDFRTPYPRINAWLDWKAIEGVEFQRNGHVTLTIGDLTYEADVEPAWWNPTDPTQTYVRFDIGADGHSLEPGDRVVMSDGSTTKELLVPPLEVTGYDLGARTVSGVYDPDLSFSIGIHDLEVTDLAFDGNTWVATFGGLGPNMWGDAIQTDSDGDDVRATIHTPNPMMYAFPDDNVVAGVVWTEGKPLTLKVYDSITGESVYESTEIVPPPSEVPWTAVHFYPGNAGYHLKSGDRLVMSQGGYTRELVVSSIQVRGFDLATRTVFGTGDPDASFLVRINGVDIWSAIGQDGSWSVHHESLQPGVWGEAIQPDADGDETRDGFQAPSE